MKFKLNGFLSRDDMKILKEASVRKSKYKKIHTKKWNCVKCNYDWFYKTIRCPTCSSTDISLKV